jgi:superfamily II DNA or RNA helicase
MMQIKLRIVGEDIQGALIQSINDFTSPALAASTIARKGFDKPLIDTAVMVNSTGIKVVK